MTSTVEQNIDEMDRKQLIELLEMTEDWSSKTDTKFHLYEPTTIAATFHASRAKVRAHFGGNRSSKTYSHIIDYACQFTGEVPESLKGIVPEWRLEPTRRNRMCMNDYPNNFMKVIWPYIKQLIPQHYIVDVIKENGRIKAIVNKSGGFLEFMQYDQDVAKFQGTSRHSIGCDEEPPEDINDENAVRLIDTDGEETYSLTPVSGALKYLFDRLYVPRGRKIEKDYEFILKDGRLSDVIEGEVLDVTIPTGDQNIHCFFSCIFDNPALTKEAAIRILSRFPSEEMIIRGKGHFLFLSGLVLKKFNDATHVLDPEAFQKGFWLNGPTSENYTIYIAIDPHPRTPHAVLFYAARKDGLAFLVDEIFDDCTAQVLAKQIVKKLTIDPYRGKVPNLIIIDPLAWTPDPISKSDFGTELRFELALLGLDVPLISASKDKSNGVMKLKQALTLNERGYAGIYVAPWCERVRWEISHWAWDTWKKASQATNEVKQAPIKKNDHMMENWYRLTLLNGQHVEGQKIFTILNRQETLAYEEEEESEPVTSRLRNPY